MIRHLGSSLTDVTYVFDEPTAGLHPHDVQRMNDLLLRLRDKGNTVLVVEHEPETIAIADHVVDLGPGAGTSGGTVCFEGTVEGLRRSGTTTGQHLDDRATLKPSVRKPSGQLGVRGASLHNLQDVDVDIPLGVLTVVCGGKRFDASVLEYRFGGRDISEVLSMQVSEAREFFGAGKAHIPAALAILRWLDDVGLGYLGIGQPLTTLSGGERQRLKLATHMADKGDVFVLDEPTSGLHLADVEQLLELLDRLVDSGKSVIVVEHHQAVMAHADWIIDLGPGAGQDGGRIVFEGTPGDLVAARSTLTGEHLAEYVGVMAPSAG